MAVIFQSKDSVFFVGGRGAKTGDANAGGCTKEAWDDPAKLNQDLSNVMGTNGEVLSGASAWTGSQNGCSVSDDSGKVRLTCSGAFGNCSAGLVANVAFPTGEYADGRYEVLTAAADYIRIDLDYSATGQTTADAKVGGAFDTLQNASDNTSANMSSPGPWNVWIYTNKNEIVSSQIDIDTGGGSGIGTRKIIEGFYTAPGDMRRGGAHYGEYTEFDANGGTIRVFYIKNISNVEFRNIHATNSDQGANHEAFFLSGTTSMNFIRFVNCRASYARSGWRVNNYNVYGLHCIDCIAHDNSAYGFYFYGRGHVAMNCKSYKNTAYDFYTHAGTNLLLSCIADGQNTASSNFYMSNGQAFLVNCVFYNAANYGVHTNGVAACVYMTNTIVKGAGVRNIYNEAGNCIIGDYNCHHEDGSSGSRGYNNRFDLEPLWAQHDLEGIDPKFFDAAGSDFRLLPDSACLNTGKETLDNGYTSIGAWQRKSLLR